MLAQAIDFMGIDKGWSPLWLTNVNFVVSDDVQRQVLMDVVSTRPPGLFPTGIICSTVVYLVCRSIFISRKTNWPLVLAMLTIGLVANRTLGVVFLLVESIAFVRIFGVLRFVRAVMLISVLLALGIVVAGSLAENLFVFKFFGEQLAGAELAIAFRLWRD
ncbi:MAG: hypothetical protein WDM77_02870 [Steroidobacteraceae bacterium]